MEGQALPEDFPQPKVTSPAGTFKGSILKSFTGQTVGAFRGIPYALPPVGSLRFARPLPHPNIEGEYDATQECPNSIQPVGSYYKAGQEDCLYLNVFLPAPGGQIILPPDMQGPSFKKVLVFIHGGDHCMGSANQHVPGDFVAQGDVIVVTLNFRLSWLGFLNGPVDELKGNLAFWDQLMALKWVKNNIKSFGGDPEDMTLAGQSSGAECVSALSISPFGKGLFTKGLLFSGSLYTRPMIRGTSDILFDELAERLCLPKPHPRDCAEFLETLRKLPEEKFHLPYELDLTNKFKSVDGEIFPQSIEELRKDPEYLTDVGFYDRDYLVTLTNNEGQCLWQGTFECQGIREPDEESQAKTARLPTSVYRKVLECYSQPEFESRWPKNDICVEPMTIVPSFEFLDTSSAKMKAPKKFGRSYCLWFDHMPSYFPPSIEGSLHCIDLCYLFDLTPDEILKTFYASSTDKTFTEEDKRLKSEYIKIITEFMKNGDPNCSVITSQTGKDWPEYEPENEFYLNFSNKPAIKKFPIKKRRNLWKSCIPEWIENACDN